MFDLFLDLVLVAAVCFLWYSVRFGWRLPRRSLLLSGACLPLLLLSACGQQQNVASTASPAPTLHRRWTIQRKNHVMHGYR